MPVIAEVHPFAFGAAAFFIAIFAMREAIWRFFKPVKQCETCGHAGVARRVVRGKYWIEILLLGVGLSAGLVVHLLLVFSILVFVWRTFGAYLTCAQCGSERLDPVV